MATAGPRRAGNLDAGADYYSLLGIGHAATFREIAKAYRTAMMETHPDRVPPDRRAAAEERAKQLNLAFRTLSNPDLRLQYDRDLRATAVQDQIMNRYVGGLGGSGVDPFGASLRREPTAEDRRQQRRADRGAMVSLVLVFGGVAGVMLALLVIWAALSSLWSAVF